MALNGHLGTTKAEAAERERECFIESWTHQAVMAVVRRQDQDYPQLEKLSDYEANATFMGAEIEKLDEELEQLQDSLSEGNLVATLLTAIRGACHKAMENDENLYFFSDQESGA